ncbi:MAG: hypothetical protein ACUVX8_18755, partial [Candidatus Zipacnadales bacterium]
IETVLTGSLEQPVVAKPQEAIQQAVKEAVVQGKFAVTARGETFRGDISESVFTDPDVKIVPIGQPVAPPREPEPVRHLRLEIEIPAKSSYPLRKVLESLQGTNAQITVKIKDSDGSLAGKRGELEKLLNDYSVSHTWSESELHEDL